MNLIAGGSKSREDQWVFLVLALALGCVYWPLVMGHAVLPWDALVEFYPNAYFNATAVRSGQLPWWNPFIYGGVPQVADPQAMTFSPLLVAWMLLRENPSPSWFTYGILLHLLLGGWAFSIYVGKLGTNVLGRTAGSLVFIFGGVAASRIQHAPAVISYCYLALVCALCINYIEKPGRLKAIAFGVSGGFFCVHLVQVTYLGLGVVAAFAVHGLIWRAKEKGWPATCVNLRRNWLFAAIPALVLSLPQLLCTFAYVLVSNRQTLPLNASDSGSLNLAAFWTLFSPNHFNALYGEYSGPADLTEANLYIGLLPICILVGGYRAALGNKALRRHVFFFTGILAISSIYMLGTSIAVYKFFYEYVPGVQLFRRPSDSAFIFNFSAATLVAFAFSTLPRLTVAYRNLLIGLAVLILIWNLRELEVSGGLLWFVLVMGVAAIAVNCLRTGPMLKGALITCLIVSDFALVYGCGRFFAGDDLTLQLRASQTHSYVHEAANAPGKDNWRLEGRNTAVWWDDFAMLSGIRSTQGYNPIKYALFDGAYGARPSGEAPRPSRDFNARAGSALFNLLSVKYLVVGQDDVDVVYPLPETFRKVVEDRQFSLWINDKALPHVLTPERTHLLLPEKRPLESEFETTDFADEVWLTPRNLRDYDEAMSSSAKCAGRLRIDGLASKLNSLSLDVTSTSGGWLIDGDLDFPGWVASIDGKPVFTNRANLIFRAVCVPSGQHHVKFVFHPMQMILQAFLQPSSYRWH